MAELSDAEVFGTAPTPASRATAKELSDAEVFGAPAKAMSDADVGIVSEKPKPGAVDYLGEIGKRVATGLVEGSVVAPLHGLGGLPSNPDFYPETTISNTFYEAMSGEKPRDIKEGMKVTDDPAYRLGTTISEATSKALPDRKLLNPLVSDVATAVGSVGGNIATGLLPGVRTLAPAAMVLQGAGEAAERGVKAGATDDQIRRAAGLGNVAGATEFADLLLVNLGSWGKVAGLVKQVGVNVLKGAVIEGGQEGLQQFIQNAVAKGIYKPEQSLTEDVAYNAVIGAIVGGGVSGVMTRREATETPPSPEDIATSAAPIDADTELGVAPTPGPAPAGPDPFATVDAGTRANLEAERVRLEGELQAALASGDQARIRSRQEALTRVQNIIGSSTVEPVQPELPLEPPAAPTIEETKRDTLAPGIVDFIDKNKSTLAVPENPKAIPFDDLLGPQREEITSAPGANAARLAKLLGPKLYGDPSNIAQVSVKEMFQNGFDAIKGVLEKGQSEDGNIDIDMDPATRTISVQDDGSGMTPQVLGKQFLEIAGTHKESKRASGGLGIAKMLFIFGNKNLKVTTMRDGKVSELITTGEQLFSALDDVKQAPKIQVRSPNNRDQQMFPKGHGTRVEVVIPKQFTDPGTGDLKEIDFADYTWDHPVLQKSPLFDNINVRFNGELLGLGLNFPLEAYTQFTNVNFDWGTARIYVTKEAKQSELGRYDPNVHILSNGLWQFSGEIKKNPNEPYGENIAYDLYIDVNPKVSPEEAGYPFDLNRQGFSPQSKKDFANIFNYISLLYQKAGYAESAANFGSMQFLDYDATTKTVKASTTVKVEPKVPPPPDAITLIRPGDKVKIVDGQLIVNGREVPELTPQELEKFKINPDELRIDQSEIDPDRVILHDNVDIEVSSMETRSVTDYGRERHGKRFDEFVFAIGNAFKELRDVVVKGMPGENKIDLFPPPMGLSEQGKALYNRKKAEARTSNGYENLGKEGIGVSFDQEYRGVSIKLPFSGMFLNPAVPEYSDPLRAALGMVGTMVHELAHYKVRSHNAAFPAEMQRIYIMLEANPDFNFHGFKQKVINIVAAYEDVFSDLNGVFTSGDFTVRPRGKRFEDSRSYEVRDGSSPSDLAAPRGEPESGSRLSDWVAASETIPSGQQGRPGASNQTGRSGSHRPSDNGRARNYAALRGIDPGISAPPQQPEINAIRQSITRATGAPLSSEAKEAASHADRFNWFYKYITGVTELLDANPYFQPLRKYVEGVRMMHSDETKIHDAALRIMKDWRSLRTQSKNLENLILDIQSMSYLSPVEKRNEQWRHPTTQEFAALAAKHKVSQEALEVYNRIRGMNEIFLQLTEQNAVDQAKRLIEDPIKLAARLDEIRASGVAARATPFFPFTRFGLYYVRVADKAGNVVHFETFEPGRILGVTVKRAEKYQAAKERELKRKYPNHDVTVGVLPESAGPLIGMPTLLLQTMTATTPQGQSIINLTSAQIDAIKELQNMRNPAMSLNKRSIASPTPTAGYSLDLQRSFARYYFFGGRYYARVKHAWALRGHIAEASVAPGNKAGLIRTYMTDHLQNTVLDSRGDFGFLKGAIFIYAMGYVPAAATQNLTQTPMVTLPFLAGKFGDIAATRELVKAMSKLSSFYKRGYYDANSNPNGQVTSQFEMKALDYGIKTGRISETQAPELAGVASGANLFMGQGGTKTQRAATYFLERSGVMFELAEQWNRRIAYRAALNLALKKPEAKFVKESINKYQDEYRTLVAEFGGNTQQAAAVITAVHATDRTQFVYAKYARGRFARGGRSVIFVFQTYMKSLLVMLGQNKSDVFPRFLIMAMLMGGLGGVPGYESFASIFHAFAKWWFGKDIHPNRLIREYVKLWTDGKYIEPDLVLHGLARRGFGWPALIDLMGSAVYGNTPRGLSSQHSTNTPFPILDRSRSIGLGTILPVDLGKLISPGEKADKVIADQAQKASGAVFGVGFNMYKAVFASNEDPDDFKRWEKAVPRAFASASRSYRAFSEGRERGKGKPNSAPTIVPYDRRDTEEMMEIIALGMGYQPLRQQAKWDSIIAQAEVKAFYDIRKKGLMEQMFEAQKGRDKEEIAKVVDSIKRYNQGLPDWAKGKAITGDTLRRSMEGRQRQLTARESGVPVQKSDIGIARHIQGLFPEATVDVRRVR